ncbi:unnamed protein product [Lymnaea stagnalis]|uniref:Beta-1,4-galactosyltransferase n=1 Tax=Lymnaea stagnalis TaxID=6523 RepID=A0AAV2HYJ7_LYMST
MMKSLGSGCRACHLSTRRSRVGVLLCLGSSSIVLFSTLVYMNQAHMSFQKDLSHSDPPDPTTICIDIQQNSLDESTLNVSRLPSGQSTQDGQGDDFTANNEDVESFIETVPCNFSQINKSLPVAGQKGQQNTSSPCPDTPPFLVGRFAPPMTMMTPQELAAFFPDMAEGGHYKPRMCRPAEKTAILIPYRNRCSHLYILLPVLIPMLMRQNIDFTIYVVEQTANGTFNKGIMFNAGYLESLKVDNYDCFILHDVDLIPIDDRNLYRCNKSGPVHFSPAVSKFNYKETYHGLFGGVVSFTREHFKFINGASNVYFGWGAEDDDLRDRAANKNLTLLRKNMRVGVYDMVAHSPDKGWDRNPDRLKTFATRKDRQDVDGLNTVIYNTSFVRKLPVYTWIGVDFDKDTILATVPKHLLKAKKNVRNISLGKFKIV